MASEYALHGEGLERIPICLDHILRWRSSFYFRWGEGVEDAPDRVKQEEWEIAGFWSVSPDAPLELTKAQQDGLRLFRLFDQQGLLSLGPRVPISVRADIDTGADQRLEASFGGDLDH